MPRSPNEQPAEEPEKKTPRSWEDEDKLPELCQSPGCRLPAVVWRPAPRIAQCVDHAREGATIEKCGHGVGRDRLCMRCVMSTVTGALW